VSSRKRTQSVSTASRTASGTAPSLSPILAVNFVGALGFGIVLPFLVFLVTRLGGNAVVYGLLASAYPAFQLAGAPVLGRWSDRIGRRKVLLLSEIGTLAAWGLFMVALALPAVPLAEVETRVLGAFTLSLPLAILFLARALDGVTGGNVSVASAYLADVTPEDERSAAFGRLAVSSNLGYIAGPALAGILGALGPGEWLPVLVAFLASLAATLVITFALEDPDPCVLTVDPERVDVGDLLGGDQKQCYQRLGAAELSTRQILRIPHVARLLGLQFLVFLGFNLFYVAFPVHAATRLEWSVLDVGLYFAFISVLMAVVEGPVLGRLSRRLGDRPLVIAGSLILAGAFLFFLSARTLVLYGGTVLVAAGNGLMWPSLLATLSKTVDRPTQGAVQGLAGSVNAVASILGLVLGGLIYGVVGTGVFVLSAAATGLVFLLAFGIPGPGADQGGEGRSVA
jgi:DHA1 family tetracycline resistance protein-like MFS transporter